jgi:glycosyltransferase involved in cell wall biosynthesis
MKAPATTVRRPTNLMAASCETTRDPGVNCAADHRVHDVRAIFVLSSLSVGGSETKTVRVVNTLLRRGVRAGVAYLNRPDDLRGSLEPDIPVWHLQRRGKFSPAVVGALRRLIREQRPHTVFAVNLYPALYVALAVFGVTNRPRTVGLINTTEFPEGSEWRASFYRPFLRRFDTTVYGCELQRSRWLSLLHYPRERSAVMYNGVDAEHFAPAASAAQALAERRRLGIEPQAFVIGTVGRLAPEKNQVGLIDAVAELRRRSIPAHLLLVGEGSLREQLGQRAAQHRIERYVTFAGKQRDVRPALSTMDVFVLPSTHVETFSNAALEAMAMCKPVVLSRIGGAAEMVREGVEGFTLPLAELSEGLAPLLLKLHADDDLRARMGQAARIRVARQFSLEQMVEGYASLMGVCVNEAPASG